MAEQRTFSALKHALPILGRDGTLATIQVDSPAAGHVVAKTGTYVIDDSLDARALKAEAGGGGVRPTRKNTAAAECAECTEQDTASHSLVNHLQFIDNNLLKSHRSAYDPFEQGYEKK